MTPYYEGQLVYYRWLRVRSVVRMAVCMATDKCRHSHDNSLFICGGGASIPGSFLSNDRSITRYVPGQKHKWKYPVKYAKIALVWYSWIISLTNHQITHQLIEARGDFPINIGNVTIIIIITIFVFSVIIVIIAIIKHFLLTRVS